MNLNSIAPRRYGIDRRLYKVPLSSRYLFFGHRFRSLERKGRDCRTRQGAAQAHRTTTLRLLASQERVRIATLMPKLGKEKAARFVHRRHDRSPRLDLFRSEPARDTRPTRGSYGHGTRLLNIVQCCCLPCFRYNESTWCSSFAGT